VASQGRLRVDGVLAAGAELPLPVGVHACLVVCLHLAFKKEAGDLAGFYNCCGAWCPLRFRPLELGA
jgi:hypothetical protein